MLGYAQSIYEKIKGRKAPSKIPGSLFWQEEAFGISGVSFDLLINETHGLEFDVSEHVIENGETVSDNVRRHLRKVTIVGLFTNHQIYSNVSEWLDNDEPGKFVKGSDKIKIDGQEMLENRARDEKWEALKEVANARKPVRLVTAMETYDNMVITSLRTARGPEDGEAVKFEMELSEIRSIGLVAEQYDIGTYKPKTQKTPEDRAAAVQGKGGNVSAQDVKAAQMAQELAGVNSGEMGGI